MKHTLKNVLPILTTVALLACRIALAQTEAYPVVDTGHDWCYGNSGEIACPDAEEAFWGQDAQYQGNIPAYRDNGDGTVTDLTSGLMWQKGLGTRKVSLEEALEMAETMTLRGYSDWRVPTIKELYSLMDFRGNTGSAHGNLNQGAPADAVPYINTDYFDFTYGNVGDGERYIDAQWLSCTEYVSTTMNGMDTLFGVNFADGRIKGYGYRKQGSTRLRGCDQTVPLKCKAAGVRAAWRGSFGGWTRTMTAGSPGRSLTGRRIVSISMMQTTTDI